MEYEGYTKLFKKRIGGCTLKLVVWPGGRMTLDVSHVRKDGVGGGVSTGLSRREAKALAGIIAKACP